MHRIKGILFVLTGLFVVITLFSLLIPSRVMTARSVVIHADPVLVYNEIADLKNWKHWHPVFVQDSNKISFTQNSSGKDAAASWASNNKENKLVITGSTNKSIELLLQRPGENDVKNIISINPVNDSTAIQVEWRALVTLKWYPWEKFYGIFVEKVSGPGYEMALNKLKELVEKK